MCVCIYIYIYIYMYIYTYMCVYWVNPPFWFSRIHPM